MICYNFRVSFLGSYDKPQNMMETREQNEVFVKESKRRMTSHLLITSDQKPSVYAHDYLGRMKILIPQFLVTSLFEQI